MQSLSFNRPVATYEEGLNFTFPTQIEIESERTFSENRSLESCNGEKEKKGTDSEINNIKIRSTKDYSNLSNISDVEKSDNKNDNSDGFDENDDNYKNDNKMKAKENRYYKKYNYEIVDDDKEVEVVLQMERNKNITPAAAEVIKGQAVSGLNFYKKSNS